MRVLCLVSLACLLVAPPALCADHEADARAAVGVALAIRQAPLPPQAPPVPVSPDASKQSRRPDGGYCSPACRCGCNEGTPCQCGTFRTPQTAPQPHVHPSGLMLDGGNAVRFRRQPDGQSYPVWSQPTSACHVMPVPSTGPVYHQTSPSMVPPVVYPAYAPSFQGSGTGFGGGASCGPGG
jgi:hypothetical protein